MTTAPELPEQLSLGPPAELMRTLWQLNHVLERASRRLESVSGVTAQQRMIIRCIGKYPGMTAGQLATHFHLDPGTVSVAIDRLEEKGLVERRRTERDRRRVMLGLTAEGRAIDAAVVGPAERAFGDLLEKAESADVASTHRVLALLADLIESALERDRRE